MVSLGIRHGDPSGGDPSGGDPPGREPVEVAVSPIGQDDDDFSFGFAAGALGLTVLLLAALVLAVWALRAV
jgi:hypothetical protein